MSKEINSGDMNKKNTLRIESNFYRNTISSKYKIDIPEGPLFYPCSGHDTYKPIRLFFDSISEFNFVDSRIIPQLPQLECNLIGNNEKKNLVLTRNNNTNLPIRKELISSAIAFDPYDDTINNQKIADLDRKGIKPAEYNGETGKIYKQEWQLVRGNRKVNIYRHKQDGLATFCTLGNIAVFYLVRDSEGEGGSGQRWFQKSIFDYILDKLLDRGLIVTDGSGYDYNIINTAQWKSLWANTNAGSKNKSKKPEDFIYKERKFNCLGECGKGYGPIYIWQVIKLNNSNKE